MSEIKPIQGEFKRTIPHVCQGCGLCCQGRGDLWYDEDLWPTDCEPDNCTAYDPKTKSCTAYDNRRGFCEDYPWDEWCERELKEMGLWEKYLNPTGRRLNATDKRRNTKTA